MSERSRLVLYDTTNFMDFPIGGQLTSVRNFLKFLAEVHADRMKDVVLVGVTRIPEELGIWQKLSLESQDGRTGAEEHEEGKAPATVHFLPVAIAEENLGHTAHSLRLRYAKGLLKYGRMLHLSRFDCNYFQTPEAVGPVWLLQPFAHFVIFSHGSFANMDKGFRFFQDKPFVRRMFSGYLKWMLRKADLIFILDEDSRRDYQKYTDRMEKPGNSIVLPEQYDVWKPHVFRGRILFVGRLSKMKRVDGIIRAMALLPEEDTLTVVGDGEERDALSTLTQKLGLSERVSFTGAVSPVQTGTYMDEADILIMNSDFEGVPMTILEALSHGIPVITTDVGGIGETVRFGTDALQTDGTPESIAKAAEHMKQDYERFAECAHQHGADYDYRLVNRKIYDSLCRFWKER